MSTSPPEPRAEVTWCDRTGESWVRLEERIDAQLEPLGQALIARLSPRPGERVIDVGCGTGRTLIALAEKVGSHGHVVGIDISEIMTARARQRVAEARSAQVSLVCGDAQSHAFTEGTFDVVFSRLGAMFFTHPVAAFGNLGRALRPGGRLGLVSWQSLARNPWAQRPLDAVLAVSGTSPPAFLQPGQPGPFALADRDRVGEILTSAGFREVECMPLEDRVQFGAAASLEEAVDYALEIGPAARVVADHPALRSACRAALAAALAPFANERGVWLDNAAWQFTAHWP